MKQLAVVCMSLFFAIFFFENCRIARKATSLNEQKTWEQVVWDSNSIILKIANKKESVAKGTLLYKQYCSICHGHQGEVGIAPNLTDDYWLHGGNKIDIAKTIVYGVPDNGMRPWQHLLYLTPPSFQHGACYWSDDEKSSDQCGHAV